MQNGYGRLYKENVIFITYNVYNPVKINILFQYICTIKKKKIIIYDGL